MRWLLVIRYKEKYESKKIYTSIPIVFIQGYAVGTELHYEELNANCQGRDRRAWYFYSSADMRCGIDAESTVSHYYVNVIGARLVRLSSQKIIS